MFFAIFGDLGIGAATGRFKACGFGVIGAVLGAFCFTSESIAQTAGHIPDPILAPVTRPNAMQTGTDAKGWHGVGKLLLGERGFCTAVLIEPHLVLTAAHCLYDSETSARTPDSLLIFQAGWRNGRAEAYRGVRRALAHPDYLYTGEDELERVSYDLALIELDRPIQLPQLRPYLIGQRPDTGHRVSVVSYAQGRAETASIEEDCAVLMGEPSAMVLSCDIDFGSSGAPVFVQGEQGPRLVSVISAKADYQGRKVALAAPLELRLVQLREALSAVTPVRRRAAGVKVISSEGALGGASFTRP